MVKTCFSHDDIELSDNVKASVNILNGYAGQSLSLTEEEQDWLKKNPVITVAFDGDFAPYSYLNAQKEFEGIAVDYFKLIEQKLGIQLSFSSKSQWDDLYTEAKRPDSTIDVVASMVNREQRQQWFSFTQPYIFKSLVVVTRKDNTSLTKRRELGDKKIVLVQGYQYTDRILKEFPTIKPYYVKTNHDALEMVAAGKADGTITFVALANWYRDIYFLKNLHVAALYDRNTANESIAINKNKPELASILSKALASITIEERNAIARKWLPDISKYRNYQLIEYQLLLVLIIAIVLFVSLMIMRKKNKQLFIAHKEIEQANDSLQKLTESLESEVKERTQKLFQLSYHDELTGLGNKNYFFNQCNQLVEQCIKLPSTFALVCFDIDRFKYINDNLGHKVGDGVIIQVSQRLQENRFSDDIIARFGGDSFTLVLPNVTSDDAIVIVRKLIARLKEPYMVFKEPINISVSAGIAMYPQDGATTATLHQRAEQALFEAKKEHSGVEICGDHVIENFSKYLLLEQAVLKAVNQLISEETVPFQLNFQPIKWLKKPGLKGVEALIRWQHEEMGWVSPQKFISMAEDIGRINDISAWVRKTAFKQAKTWHDNGVDFGRISINLSALEFQNTKLIQQLEQEVIEAEARFEWIEIEITETAILKNPTVALAKLYAMKTLGATISLDDFGTGYSSLVYLKQIPADTVKIDREFVKNLPNDAIDVSIDQSIIELSHALHMIVVAEGVETPEQCKTLKAMGCDSIQGYIISKAIPAEIINQQLIEQFDNLMQKKCSEQVS